MTQFSLYCLCQVIQYPLRYIAYAASNRLNVISLEKVIFSELQICGTKPKPWITQWASNSLIRCNCSRETSLLTDEVANFSLEERWMKTSIVWRVLGVRVKCFYYVSAKVSDGRVYGKSQILTIRSLEDRQYERVTAVVVQSQPSRTKEIDKWKPTRPGILFNWNLSSYEETFWLTFCAGN